MKGKKKTAGLSYLLRYDLARGLRFNWARYLVALLCLVALSAAFLTAFAAIDRSAVAVGASAGRNARFGFTDVLSFFYAGSDYYRLDGRTPFVLPGVWLIQQILVAFLVGSYTVHDLDNEALQVLVRAGKRWVWWLSKCCWTGSAVLLFYVLELLVALATTAAFGSFAGGMGDFESSAILGFTLSSFGVAQLVAALLLPLGLSLALSLIQSVLSLLIGPFLALVSLAAYTVVSAYFGMPMLIGDYSMMARSALVNENGIAELPAFVICAAVCAASIVLGALILRRRDLAGGQDEPS